MRAHEFITEGSYTIPDMDHKHAHGLGRVDLFNHPQMSDKTHAMYRLMMAAGESNGDPDQKLRTSPNSFAGTHNFATPFSELDGKMLDAAYKHLGLKTFKNIAGPTKSMERDDVQKVSPARNPGPIQRRR